MEFGVLCLVLRDAFVRVLEIQEDSHVYHVLSYTSKSDKSYKNIELQKKTNTVKCPKEFLILKQNNDNQKKLHHFMFIHLRSV